MGIKIGVDFDHPFDVKVRIDPNIGGPSAGLMFSLAIYDTLTPGSLTGDQADRGHGDHGRERLRRSDRRHHAEDRRAPGTTARTCSSSHPTTATRPSRPRNGDMRLVKAVTMHAAVQAIEAWVKDPEAKLPTCRATNERKAEG